MMNVDVDVDDNNDAQKTLDCSQAS
jgi:hypothetical protein